MKDDTELKMNDSWSNENTYSAKPRRIQSGNSKLFQILLGILLVLIFAGGITYFLSKQSPGGEAVPLQSRVTVLEQKMARLEKQIAEIQEKNSPPNLSLLQQVETLVQKMETLEKQGQSMAELRAKPSSSLKPALSNEKQYHKVQRGETLYQISKKYGISIEELQNLNNLSPGKTLRIGQKLQISP